MENKHHTLPANKLISIIQKLLITYSVENNKLECTGNFQMTNLRECYIIAGLAIRKSKLGEDKDWIREG